MYPPAFGAVVTDGEACVWYCDVGYELSSGTCLACDAVPVYGIRSGGSGCLWTCIQGFVLGDPPTTCVACVVPAGGYSTGTGTCDFECRFWV